MLGIEMKKENLDDQITLLLCFFYSLQTNRITGKLKIAAHSHQTADFSIKGKKNIILKHFSC